MILYATSTSLFSFPAYILALFGGMAEWSFHSRDAFVRMVVNFIFTATSYHDFASSAGQDQQNVPSAEDCNTKFCLCTKVCIRPLTCHFKCTAKVVVRDLMEC